VGDCSRWQSGACFLSPFLPLFFPLSHFLSSLFLSFSLSRTLDSGWLIISVCFSGLPLSAFLLSCVLLPNRLWISLICYSFWLLLFPHNSTCLIVLFLTTGARPLKLVCAVVSLFSCFYPSSTDATPAIGVIRLTLFNLAILVFSVFRPVNDLGYSLHLSLRDPLCLVSLFFSFHFFSLSPSSTFLTSPFPLVLRWLVLLFSLLLLSLSVWVSTQSIQ
jgi:hypothetical protein